MMDDSNSVMIRLKQIQEDGKITITSDDIFINYQSSDNPSYVKEITNYKRIFTYDELSELDSAIELLSNESIAYNEIKQLYSKYRDCFKQACEIQRQLKILHSFGKSFIYYNILFFNLNEEDEKNTYEQIKTLIKNYNNKFVDQNPNPNKNLNNQNQPLYPQFISQENLLYFGSLLQRMKINKVFNILNVMFHFDIKEKPIIEEFITNSMKNQYIYDPMKSAIQLFTSIYNYFFPPEFSKYIIPKNPQSQDSLIIKKFENLQKELQIYFMRQNFITIKVNIPSEAFHILNIISILLYNDPSHTSPFFENFFCDEKSDILSYLSDFEKRSSSWIRIQYAFIVHPEFLSSDNQKNLKEKITSRMTPIPDMPLQKFVIITSSNEFVFGNEAEDLKENEVFTQRESSIKVDSNLMRNYITKITQFFFNARFYQSENAGTGKTTFIKREIEKMTKNNDAKFKVFNHFISDGNQRIPFEFFSKSKSNIHIIHFQFSDDIMKQGIKFWSHLFQLYTQGYVLPKDSEPLFIQSIGKNIVFFEIPHLNDKNIPIENFNEFPLPISTNFQMYDEDEKVIEIEETVIKNDVFIMNEKYEKYFNFEMNSIFKGLTSKPSKIKNMKDYIEFMYKTFFNVKKAKSISFRKLGYIEKYLHKHTKLYINSISSGKINDKEFIVFFYLLTICSFYAYNYLPDIKITDKIYMKGYGLVFITINDLFNNRNNKSSITFYTTKSKKELLKHLEKSFMKMKISSFVINFDCSDEQNQIPQEILQKIFCSSQEYGDIVKNHIKMNPQSYISSTQITLPSLFRSSILLNRIFLSQPIIMSGDTGCGKTSTLMLLYEYFNLPINKKMYSLDIEICKTLNCHSGIKIDDVINHIKNASKSSKKHVIFFDELNTSPASSYIEHILLNENIKYHSKFVFIGALNPLMKKNPISSNLTKVGLTQVIKGEEKKINLIEPIPTKKDDDDENMSDMMYHVNPPQEATQDIIFDFNPICYKEKYDIKEKFYPDEEKYAIHSIIEKMANNKNAESLEILKGKIDICINFIRQLMNERAVISYRDIKRTMIIYNELLKLYNDNDDIPIITVIISFVLRLPNRQEFSKKDIDKGGQKYSETFESIYKQYFNPKGNKSVNYIINSRDTLLSLLGDVNELKAKFMNFVYQYTIDYLNDNKIWKFKSTFIHLFIMDICIRCKLPCFIIGMPGTSKSYAFELLQKKYKENLYSSTYMSSRTSSPDGIKSQYYDAAFKEIENIKNNNENHFCVVFIDEMGNANINPSRPLKFLHRILDHGLVLNNESGYSIKVATIGVSNYTMDFANMNRGILVYTGLPELDEIVTVFSFEANPLKKIKNVDSYTNFIEKLDKSHIENIFKYLWLKKKPWSILKSPGQLKKTLGQI